VIQHTSRSVVAVRSLLAAAVISSTMLVTLGAGITSAAAGTFASASSSAFCTTIKTFAVAEPPKYVTISTYHVYAKFYLPSYEKLASEAPKASLKKLLNEAVVILKYEAKATSLSKLEKFVVAERGVWNKGVLAITQSVITCYTT
jgi:hypothetical protein